MVAIFLSGVVPFSLETRASLPVGRRRSIVCSKVAATLFVVVFLRLLPPVSLCHTVLTRGVRLRCDDGAL